MALSGERVAVLVMIDLDNTLADRDGAVRAWINEFGAEHGLTDEDRGWIHRLDNDGYSNRREVFEAIRNRFALETSVDLLLESYQRRVVELIEPSTGAHDCLVELRAADHASAIVSNGSSGQQHAKIERLGFRSLVDAVSISGDLDITKPDPRIFQHAAAATGQRLDQARMVGDSAMHDIDGAQRIGVRTAWLRRGRSWDPTLSAPDLVLDSLSELLPGLGTA